MTPVMEKQLMHACRTLFGQEISLSPEFLGYLQLSGAKSAFRLRAKEHHPDRFAEASPTVRQKQNDRFREIHQAYRLLQQFLSDRHRPCPRTSPRERTEQSRHQDIPKKHVARPEGAPLPKHPLEFGIFAYYRGKITYQDLIAAVVWQRRQRPSIGALAVRWGWLSENMVGMIVRQPGAGQRFGDKARSLGYLSQQQVDILLRRQRGLQQRIGRYFVEQGLLSEAEVVQLVQELQDHNRRVLRSQRR
ncbi:MAG: J domain-containing protein [Desulfuromonas sp.]|nr:MAG: J domain-containing protein [Desulfuromonas sp.]